MVGHQHLRLLISCRRLRRTTVIFGAKTSRFCLYHSSAIASLFASSGRVRFIEPASELIYKLLQGKVMLVM